MILAQPYNVMYLIQISIFSWTERKKLKQILIYFPKIYKEKCISFGALGKKKKYFCEFCINKEIMDSSQ